MKDFQASTHTRVDEPDVNAERNFTQAETGFNFALGFISSFTYRPAPINTFGLVEVSIYKNQWQGGNNEQGEFEFDYKSIPMALRTCNQKDLDDNFYEA